MDTTDDLFRRLEQLNEVGVALSRERDINPLLVFCIHGYGCAGECCSGGVSDGLVCCSAI